MDWVRTQRTWSGWLALAALVLQLTLSFGHIHAEDFPGIGGGVTAGQAAALHADGDAGGDNDRSIRHADCATCATVHLAVAPLPAPPSQAPWPARNAHDWRAASDAYDVAQASRQSFQARAPPRG